VLSSYDITECNEPPTLSKIAERKGLKKPATTKVERRNEKLNEKTTNKISREASFDPNRYAVIDFETTGLSPSHGDRSLEIGIAILENNNVIDTYQSLMNPGIKVPEFITGLTGITQKMISNAPSSEIVMKEAHEFVSGTCLVAHNANFDKKFWEFELNKIGIVNENRFLCTMLISRRIYPWASNHKLNTLVNIHDIKVKGQHHRALADALMAADLFIRIQNDIGFLYEAEKITPDFLLRYQKRPKSHLKSAPEKVQDVKNKNGMELKDVVATEEFKNDVLLSASCCEGNISDIESDYQQQIKDLNDYYRDDIKELKAYVAPEFLKERRAEIRARQKKEKAQLREATLEWKSEVYEELKDEIEETLKSSLANFEVKAPDSAVSLMSKQIASSEIKKIKANAAKLKKEKKEKSAVNFLEAPVYDEKASPALSPAGYSQINRWDWIAYALLAIVALIFITELI